MITNIKTFNARYIVRGAMLKRYENHVIAGTWNSEKFQVHCIALNRWTLRGIKV